MYVSLISSKVTLDLTGAKTSFYFDLYTDFNPKSSLIPIDLKYCFKQFAYFAALSYIFILSSF